MLTESLIQTKQNPLVVIGSHLGIMWFHGDQPDKQLLLDQQEIWVCCSWKGW